MLKRRGGDERAVLEILNWRQLQLETHMHIRIYNNACKLFFAFYSFFQIFFQILGLCHILEVKYS